MTAGIVLTPVGYAALTIALGLGLCGVVFNTPLLRTLEGWAPKHLKGLGLTGDEVGNTAVVAGDGVDALGDGDGDGGAVEADAITSANRAGVVSLVLGVSALLAFLCALESSDLLGE